MMTRPLLVALALLVARSPAARADDSLDGVWLPKSAEIGGMKFPDEIREAIRLEIRGEQYSVTVQGKPDRGTCKLDPKATPKTLDITGTEGPNKGRTILAIYERDGDSLRICYELGGKGRPDEFKTAEGGRRFLVDYRLRKP